MVLSLAGVATAGLSFEQVEQFGFAASDARPPAQAVVLRAGEKLPVTTWLDGEPIESRGGTTPAADDDDLPVERVEYGDGDAIVVTVHDVRDDLGDELTRALLKEREREGRTLAGRRAGPARERRRVDRRGDRCAGSFHSRARRCFR